MLLNKLEFIAMNNPVRRLVQRTVEVRRLRKLSNLKAGEDILEIGCGSGYGSRLILQHFRPKSITAIDLDSRMIKLAQSNNINPRVAYMVGDAAKLIFPDKKFNAVVDFGIIHHISIWKESLVELYRVLKPGGEIIIEDLSIESFETFFGKFLRRILTHPYRQMYRYQEFIQELKRIGFKEIKVKKFYALGGYMYFALVGKK